MDILQTNLPERLNGRARPAIEIIANGTALRVADIVLSRRDEPGPATPPLSAIAHMVIDEPTLRAVRYTALALRDATPLMLVGPTSTAKTSSIVMVASLANLDLYRVNVSSQTEVSDLVGRWEPNTRRGLTVSELQRHRRALSADSQSILACCEKERRDPDRVEQARLLRAEGWSLPDEAPWVFTEGPLIKCLRAGGILLLDEISLCPSSVIERLNSVLEKHPTFTLAEANGLTFGGSGEPISPWFRVAATQNPDYAGRASLSPAFSSRFTSTHAVEQAHEVHYHQMLLALAFGEGPTVCHGGVEYLGFTTESPYQQLAHLDGLRDLLWPLATFHAKLEMLTQGGDGRQPALGSSSKQPLAYTRRDLLAVLDRLEASSKDDRSSTRATLLEAIDDIMMSRLQPDDRRRVTDVLEALGLTGEDASTALTRAPLSGVIDVVPANDWQTIARPGSAAALSLCCLVGSGRTLQISCQPPCGTAPDDVHIEIFRGRTRVAQDLLTGKLSYTASEGGAHWVRVSLLQRADRSGELQVAYRLFDGVSVQDLYPQDRSLVATVDGTVAAPGSHRDYQMPVHAGESYLLSTSPCSYGRAGQIDGAADWDTVIVLVSPDGVEIAKDDDSGVRLTSKLTFKATVSGVHTVRVRGCNRAQGPFRLSYRRIIES